jgi:hypothetical protein
MVIIIIVIVEIVIKKLLIIKLYKRLKHGKVKLKNNN